jgi:hypothetical protein
MMRYVGPSDVVLEPTVDRPDVTPEQPESETEDSLDIEAIAHYIAELAEPSPTPLDAVEPRPSRPYGQGPSTRDNSWLQGIVDVQHWLCLDRPLAHALDPKEAAALLFGQLAPSHNLDLYALRNDTLVEPTDSGLQLLETRLSRATAHRSAFLEHIQEDHSLAEATKYWRQLWEDVDSQPLQPVAIKAEVGAWGIHYFRTLAEQGDLDLDPTYQRDVVWSNSDSQLLIESVLRGIPLPSVILTEADNRHQIVDGKQRLTAILRFIGHHPTGRAYVKKRGDDTALFDSNFRKYARKHHLKPKEVADNYLPFKLKKYDQASDPLFPVSGKYYSEIRDAEITIGDESTKVSAIFERATKRYEIPVIVYQKTSIRDIHHVFGLYNRQGKKLNAEELRNAVYHHLDLTRLLLLLSGDRPDASLAPYLPQEALDRLDDTSEILASRGFGTSRFRRTKVLAWLISVLLKSPNELRPGLLSTPSTASHINSLLDDIEEGQASHPLHNRHTLVKLADDIQSTVALHHEVDGAWHPRFRNKSNAQGLASKWEELPLVASMIACFILQVASDADRLRAKIQAVREVTSGIRGPESTQNKTQWRHIALASTRILDALDANPGLLTESLTRRYEYSCIPTLKALASEPS